MFIYYRSGAVHVGDRILAINDIFVKNKPIKEVYQMLDFSGEVVKLRLQSVDARRAKKPSVENPRGLEIPDMSSLHRVSAWAEIFSELDQIVACTPSGAKKVPEAKTKAAKDDGVSESGNVTKKTGKELAESEIIATVCNEVKSGNDEFWEQFDELWEGEGSKEQTEQSVTNTIHTSEIRSYAAPTQNECTASSHDSSSGTLKGKSISIRYVVHEKCVNPTEETREKTTQRSCVYLTQDSRGKLTRDDSKSNGFSADEDTTNQSRKDSTNRSREDTTHESRATEESLEKTTQITKSLERSPSVASGYETDNSTLRSSANDLPHCGRSSRTDTETFTSIDSFDISNDADDKLLASPSKVAQSSDVLETRTFSVGKSEDHGFGFSLMPDKFKQEVYIASVLPGGPCDGLLQPLDKITKVSLCHFCILSIVFILYSSIIFKLFSLEVQ